MVELPLPHAGLPALEPLLNGGLWSRWASDGKVFRVPDFRRSVRYLRLKPRTSCRIAVFRGFDPVVHGRPPAGMLLYLFPSANRAREFYDKHASSKLWNKSAVHEPFLDPTRAAVGFPFPNDREVPALRHVYRHHRLKEIVLPFLPDAVPPGWRMSKRSTRLHLVRYKVGRRAVFRYELGLQAASGERVALPLYLKAESPATFSLPHLAFLGRLSDALDQGCVSIPVTRGIDAPRRLTLRPWLPGEDLAGRLSDRDALRKAARALAALHACAPQAPVPPIDDPVRAALSEGDALAELLPEESSRVRRAVDRIAERLGTLDTSFAVPIHGDFHPGQVLFNAGRVALIDLDRCGAGHPSLDLGSFLAHAVERQLDDERRDLFLGAYRNAALREVEPRDLKAAYCLGLLRRCARPFRDLELDWPDSLRRRIDRLEHATETIE